MNMRQESILWQTTTAETTAFALLDHDLDVDLLVIGGGFTGGAAALAAARHGADVALLEAVTVGHGGSGRNVGLVNAGLWLPPETVRARMGPAAGQRLIDILAEGPAEVFATIAAEEIACEAVRNGTLHLAHSLSGRRDLDERLRQGRASGAPLQLLDPIETARRTGSAAYHGALLDPRAGTIQPVAYVRGLARAAAAHGAGVYERSAVTAVSRAGGVWTATANGRQIRAPALLLATNAYQHGLEDVFTPHYTVMSYCQFATAPVPENTRRTILPGGEGCWDTALVMSSFRLDQAGRMIIGGVGNTDGPGRVIHHSWARRKLRKLFPVIADLPFEHVWRGRIAMTDDHIPKIVEFGPNALACFGYSGRGICPGTIFGSRMATALLTGDTAILPIAPVARHVERFNMLKAAGYELGATLTHAMARPGLPGG